MKLKIGIVVLILFLLVGCGNNDSATDDTIRFNTGDTNGTEYGVSILPNDGKDYEVSITKLNSDNYNDIEGYDMVLEPMDIKVFDYTSDEPIRVTFQLPAQTVTDNLVVLHFVSSNVGEGYIVEDANIDPTGEYITIETLSFSPFGVFERMGPLWSEESNGFIETNKIYEFDEMPSEFYVEDLDKKWRLRHYWGVIEDPMGSGHGGVLYSTAYENGELTGETSGYEKDMKAVAEFVYDNSKSVESVKLGFDAYVDMIEGAPILKTGYFAVQIRASKDTFWTTLSIDDLKYIQSTNEDWYHFEYDLTDKDTVASKIAGSNYWGNPVYDKIYFRLLLRSGSYMRYDIKGVYVDNLYLHIDDEILTSGDESNNTSTGEDVASDLSPATEIGQELMDSLGRMTLGEMYDTYGNGYHIEDNGVSVELEDYKFSFPEYESSSIVRVIYYSGSDSIYGVRLGMERQAVIDLLGQTGSSEIDGDYFESYRYPDDKVLIIRYEEDNSGTYIVSRVDFLDLASGTRVKKTKSYSNPFDKSIVKIGDTVCGLTAVDMWDGHEMIKFEGEIQISGMYNHFSYFNDKDGVWDRGVSFAPDSKSLSKLPKDMNDIRKVWFRFEDYEAIKDLFGPEGSSGEATVEIDRYNYITMASDVFNTAHLNTLVAIEEPKGESGQGTTSSGGANTNPSKSNLRSISGVFWKFAPGGISRSISGNDDVLIYSNDKVVYGVDPKTGEKLYSSSFGWINKPAIGDGVYVYTRSNSGLRVVDLYTNEVLVDKTSSLNKGDKYSEPILVDGVAYYANYNGMFKGVDIITGETVFDHYIDDDSRGYPYVYDGVVYMAGKDFYAADLSSRKLLWDYDLYENKDKTYGLNVIGNEEYIYYANSKGKVVAMTIAGHEYRSSENRDALLWVSPVQVGDTIIISDNSGVIGGYSLNLVETKWEMTIDSKAIQGLTAYGDMVYFVTENGNLYGIEAVTGNVLINYSIDEYFNTQPLVIGDVLYVGTREGNLYALR